MGKIPDLFECHRLRAKITERQCKINRDGYRSRGLNVPPIISCAGCPGLGESTSVPAPTEIPKMSTNKKKYICITPGCGKQQAKNKMCYLCNKNAEAEKHGSFIADAPEEKKLSDVITGAPAGNEKAEQKVPVTDRRLTDSAQDERDDFEASVKDRGCTCFQVAPCSFCCHPGNPANQEDESCWTTEPATCADSQTDHSVETKELVWSRDDQRTLMMLALVGIEFDAGLLASVVDEQVRAAEDYAGACHLQASDNDDVVIPELPYFLKNYMNRSQITICDACNNPITDDQKNVGHDCDLHEWCIEKSLVATPLPDVQFRKVSDSEYAEEALRGNPILHDIPFKKVELRDCGCGMGDECMRATEVEISPAAPAPPQEQVTACVKSETPTVAISRGLNALIRIPVPMPQPSGMFIPFPPDEMAALVESEVTPEVIRQFVIMGLEGKLHPVPEVQHDGR